MSTNTSKLNLLKWDVTNATDKASQFNIPASLNANWDNLDTFAGRIDEVIGTDTETFSTSSTYAVGSIVIHNNRIYKCTTAVTTAGTWNSSNWTEISIKELIDLKTVVDNALSPTSTNPVQNKKVKEALDTKENTSNKVTTLSSTSTNTQYPSAKTVYDKLVEKQTQIDALVEENAKYKAQIPTGHKKTNSVQLTDSAEGLPIENVVVGGATSQGENPSVNNPQAVHCVTGDCNVKVQNRNLIDFQEYTTNSTEDTLHYLSNLPKLKPNTTYYIYAKTKSGAVLNSSNSAFVILSSSGQLLNKPLNANFTTSASFDLSNAITCYIYTNSARANETITEFMILKGSYTSSTVPDYKSHAEQNAPLTLGNIELYDGDKIQISYVNEAGYKKVTGANVVKKIKERALTGIENWISQSPTGFYRYGLNISEIINDNSLSDDVLIYSNCFKGISFADRQTDADETIYIVCNGLSGNNGFFINTKEFSTADAFKTWLSSNNVYVVYPLATPTTTPITDTTLLSQLETLINMKTYKEITNIDTEGADLPPVIEFDYYKDMTTVDDRLSALEARIELLEE